MSTGAAGAAARPRPATSLDVARLAGVSRATVSHVLNDQVERFSQDTVDRVRKAAADLGYVRSAAARALVLGRSDFVVVVVPHTTFTNLQDIVEVISADLDELGFTVVVHFRVSEAEREVSARLHHLVDTLRPAGVIDLGGMSRRDVEVLEAAGCPVLPPSAEPESDGNIWIGRLQVEHLRARGHTRIAYAFLSDPREDAYGQTRARAAAEACAQAGLPPPVHTQVPLEGNASEAVLRDLLARTGVPLGVAAFNDEVAMALVSAAARLGVAVPGELAVVGVERSSVGQLVSPRLTTVSVDVPASLRHIRQSIASTYSGPTHPETATPFADVFTILDGETT